MFVNQLLLILTTDYFFSMVCSAAVVMWEVEERSLLKSAGLGFD